jgi:hypothetical protein
VRLVCGATAGGPSVVLADADSFDGFSVHAPAGLVLDGVGAAGDGERGEREEITVPAARVRALAQGLGLPREWFVAFDSMLAAVAPYGWYDEAADTVRAHVVRA